MNDDYLDDSMSESDFINSRSEYFEFVRLAFRIQPEDVYFLCKSEPADLYQRIRSESKLEQSIQGYSEFQCTKDILREQIIERQPFANSIFNSQKIFINITETRKDDKFPFIRPHNFSIYYDRKKKCHVAFNWKISDRSFFTRLFNSIAASKTLTFVVFLREKDNFFGKYAEDKTIELPEYIPIEGLTFSFR